MEVLAVIGVIILAAILFVAGGLSGHLIDAIGRAFSFLADGCMKWVGCLFWAIFILILLVALGS